MKPVVVGAFVSALAVLGVAPAASAAPSSDSSTVTVQTAKPVISKAIDWHASTRNIDWH